MLKYKVEDTKFETYREACEYALTIGSGTAIQELVRGTGSYQTVAHVSWLHTIQEVY
ncbi:MAG: hypothetical protein HXX08_11465 [Chloroflexi bacterium]|uniref:Uncharacterized protein n=1 Tax=Candidatus Chlorohelix allophototropha TaxID=3003348 RepID=A0A8T7LWW7_9CHLR|nr:hypothetical protein [Chloroflexota bacterium]WJW65856.1 hypothetical protein OZ401_001635 [Chloroflexota bacterium L227-S17]